MTAGRKKNSGCGSLVRVKLKASGFTQWVGRFRIEGQLRREYLGFTHELTENEARLKLLAVIQEFREKATMASALNAGPSLLRYHLDSTKEPTPRRSTGAISELMVSADMMARGYEVFRALSGHASCDLIALKDGKCYRVEVKTESPNNAYDIRRNLGNFDVAAYFSKATGTVRYATPLDLDLPKTASNWDSSGTKNAD